jgi:hypothetical protein
VLVAHAVVGMAAPQALQHRDQRLRLVEQANCRTDHLHEFLALGHHVALEQLLQRGVEGKQVGVEQLGRLRGDGLDEVEALFHQLDRVLIHDESSERCMATRAGKSDASSEPPRGGATGERKPEEGSDQAVGQPDDHDRRGGECHQNPVGQKALGCVVVAMTMFVNHVSSSIKTDPNGRFEAASQCVRGRQTPNSELRASSVAVPAGGAAEELDVVRHGVTVVADQAHRVMDLAVWHVEQPRPASHLQRVGKVDLRVRRALESRAVVGMHGNTGDCVWIPEISANRTADLSLGTR